MNNKRKRRLFKSILAIPINEFLIAKHALGKRYVNEEKVLHLLDSYLAEQQIETLQSITPELIGSFLSSRPRNSAKSFNHLHGVLQRFFNWLKLHKLFPNSPVQTPPRQAKAQIAPFIFDTHQVQQLLKTASQLLSRPTAPDRGATYRMIFALLYALGLRVGEISKLQIQDVDFQRDLLIIRDTKFSKSRLVPFGPRIKAALNEYIQQQTKRYGVLTPEQPVFSFFRKKAQPIYTNTISWTFRQLVLELRLSITPGVSQPHLHCLRHSFAVNTLLRWYRSGIDPSCRLIHLSTFMGHTCPSSTAVYITITTELLQQANQRFEQFATPILMEARL